MFYFFRHSPQLLHQEECCSVSGAQKTITAALHNTAYVSTFPLQGPYKAPRWNLLLFISLQCHSENCHSSSFLQQMSAAVLSPCTTVSCTAAAIGSSDLHFKVQLDQDASRLSRSIGKVTIVIWRIKVTSPIKQILFLVGTAEKKVWSLEREEDTLSLSSPEVRACLASCHYPHPASTKLHHATAAAIQGAAGAPPTSEEAA